MQNFILIRQLESFQNLEIKLEKRGRNSGGVNFGMKNANGPNLYGPESFFEDLNFHYDVFL